MQERNEPENSEELGHSINKQPCQMVENGEKRKLANQASPVYEPSSVDFYHGNNQQPQQVSFNANEDFYIPQHQDFQQFRINSKLMVDKSQIIIQILKIPRLYITRPRRWGKSLNLSLMRYFFKLPTDENGKVIQQNPYSYLFKGGVIPKNIQNQYKIQERQLSPLKISKHQHIMKRHHGVYPVMYLNFGRLKDKCYEQVCSQLECIIKQVYDEYSYLAYTQYSEQYQYMKKKLYQKQRLYGTFLENLCKMIINFHKICMIILVDELDAPFDSFDLKLEEIKKIRLLISGTLQILSKRTKCIKHLIMTGILMNSANLDQSGLNNVQFQDVITSDFLSQYYGFSEQQIKEQLLHKIVKPFSQQQSISLFLKRIKQWYNGYQCQIGAGKRTKIYNAQSITRYLNRCTTKKTVLKGSSFWTSSSNVQLMFKIFDTSYKMKRFQKIFQIISASQCRYCRNSQAKQLQQEGKLKTWDQTKCTKQIHQISQIAIQKDQYRWWQIKYLSQFSQIDEFHLMINLGYLTAKSTGDIYQPYIANKQIRCVLSKTFKDWQKSRQIGYQFSPINLLDTQSFVKQASIFSQKYNKNIWQINQKIIASIFAVLYSMNQCPTHRVGEQIYKGYSGLGFIGNVFLPKQNTNTIDYWAVIHQYKHVKNQTHAQFIKSVIQCFYRIFSGLYIKRIFEICPHASVKICAIVAFWEKEKNQPKIRHFQLDINGSLAEQIVQKFQKVMKDLAKIAKDQKSFARCCYEEYPLLDSKQLNLKSFISQKFIQSNYEQLKQFIVQCSEQKPRVTIRNRGQSPQDIVQKKSKN